MKILNNPKFRVGLVTLLLLVATFYGWWIFSYTHDKERLGFKKQVPKEGLAENDTDGRIPGNPENGVRVLKRRFQIYKHYHAKYPKSRGIETTKMIDDIKRNPKEYGFSSIADYVKQLANPDNRFSDNPHAREFPDVPTFDEVQKRPDGTPLFSSAEPGKRDVLAYTMTYWHENIRQYPKYRSTMNPVGFFQVLWEDGQVDNVPYDKVLYVQVSPPGAQMRTCVFAFPGQAGVPANALTYDQYCRSTGWIVPPHGVPGGKGTTYNGKSYP